MRTIVVGTEKNFAALRPVLFEGKVSSAAAKEAKQAIREANPHANLDKLEPGTVLTVPDGVPGVAAAPGPSLAAGSSDAVAALTSRGKKQLEELAEAAKARDTARKASRKQTAKALDSKALETAGKRDKRLAADVESARKALAEEDERAKERATELKKAHAEWTAGLDSLAGLLSELPNVTGPGGPATAKR